MCPRFFLRNLGELDATLCQFCVRLLHVVADKGDAAEGANAVFVSRRGKQHHCGPAVEPELNPTVAGTHSLVSGDMKAKLSRVEVQRPLLVFHRDAGELHCLNHLEILASLLWWFWLCALADSEWPIADCRLFSCGSFWLFGVSLKPNADS
jgi:hypothetical protein